MKMLLYSSAPDRSGSKIAETIGALVPDEQVECYRSVAALAKRLSQGHGNIATAVLVPTDFDDLLHLVGIRELFDTIRIVLILPDASERAAACGLMLYPRYMREVDEALDDLKAVMARLIRRDGDAPTPPAMQRAAP